jgi:hypothetical protein
MCTDDPRRAPGGDSHRSWPQRLTLPVGLAMALAFGIVSGARADLITSAVDTAQAEAAIGQSSGGLQLAMAQEGDGEEPVSFGDTAPDALGVLEALNNEAPTAELLDFSRMVREECIGLKQIERSKVIDDRNILFYLRGDVVFNNQLPEDCRFLSRYRNFEYRLSRARLCRMDRITVVDTSGAVRGRTRGASCPLGPFYRLTDERRVALERAYDLQ